MGWWAGGSGDGGEGAGLESGHEREFIKTKGFHGFLTRFDQPEGRNSYFICKIASIPDPSPVADPRLY